LCGEVLDQLDVLVGERADFLAKWLIVAALRSIKNRAQRSWLTELP
jgi:hypothetical protein